MTRIRRLVLVALAFAALTPPGSANAYHANNYHAWSYGRDDSEGANHYTAVSVTREDAILANTPGFNCTDPYNHNAHPVYQTQWLQMGLPYSGNWLELTTVHQCNGFRFIGVQQYAAWQWRPKGIYGIFTPITGGRIIARRVSSSVWDFIVNGSILESVTWSTMGNAVEAGFETRDIDIIVPSHTYRGLNYKKDVGAWQLWTGRDDEVIAGGFTCGGWDSDSQWHAGEHIIC